jgi:hypothetical protein
MRSAFWVAPIVALLAASLGRAQPPVTVLELYTSEGCSSCPPAEARLASDAQGLTVKVLGPAQPDGSELTLLSYLERAVSTIGRGENQGRTLTEVRIVRNIKTLGIWDGTARNIRIERSHLPAEATGVVVLIQHPGPAAILAAAQLTLR